MQALKCKGMMLVTKCSCSWKRVKTTKQTPASGKHHRNGKSGPAGRNFVGKKCRNLLHKPIFGQLQSSLSHRGEKGVYLNSSRTAPGACGRLPCQWHYCRSGSAGLCQWMNMEEQHKHVNAKWTATSKGCKRLPWCSEASGQLRRTCHLLEKEEK